MRYNVFRSGTVICLTCVLLILACAIFVDSSDAAVKGTTKKKEQTVMVKLKKGVALVTIKDKDSWVFSQIQTTGKNKKGSPVGGVSCLSKEGKKTTFVVPIKKSGKYFLYFHGLNPGASYKVGRVRAGRTLKSGKEVKGTSFIDDSTVVWYKIKVKKKGTLKVTVKDYSYMYPGYSKVRLKKGKRLISYEEHLLEGLGMSTTYGVTKGTYRIGVRSSSEVYKIRAKFKKQKTMKGGRNKSSAVRIKEGKPARNIVVPGKKAKGWYRIVLPKKSKNRKMYRVTLSAANSNVDIYGGMNFLVSYKKPSGDSYEIVKKPYLLNNEKVSLMFKTKKKGRRTIYIRVSSSRGASGIHGIRYDRAN